MKATWACFQPSEFSRWVEQLGLPLLALPRLSAQLGEEGLTSGLANTAGKIGDPTGTAIVVTIIGAVTRGFVNMNSPDTLVASFRYGFIAAALLGTIAFVLTLLIKKVQASNPAGSNKKCHHL